ncbi:hypothetical protein [Stenotrophomonas phage A1432]|uniref:Uncharacterized protein n=1 Tax=Stenotrophomonas phage A1432 TaxID=2930315 RepID=A0A9E7N358_9CAUD|nr:hypothetical protein P9A45_gp42 [Stenotrophomonas phage A1432]UTC27988.1 hypothetical protein [Stenotrophomonas phage A1432]
MKGFTSLFLLIAIVFLVMCLKRELDLPEVQFSYSTKECVKVLDPKAEYEGRKSTWSCDHLPERYNHTWVQ